MVNSITGIKVIIVPTAFGLALLASILYVKPAFDEMRSIKKEQTELKSQLGKFEDQNKKLINLKAKWDTMSDEKTLVDGSLPIDSSADYFLAQLYEQASKSGVILNGVSTSAKSLYWGSYVCGSKAGPVVTESSDSSENDSTDTEEVPKSKKSQSAGAASSCVNATTATIDINGTWDQLLNFFKYLGSTHRIANIRSVDISSGNESDILTVEITALVYNKEKTTDESGEIASSLKSGKGFEESVIKDLKAIVFAPYVAPSVSGSGDRNIFK